jgi:hypothetical protein
MATASARAGGGSAIGSIRHHDVTLISATSFRRGPSPWFSPKGMSRKE